jgi:hypothetical protein
MYLFVLPLSSMASEFGEETSVLMGTCAAGTNDTKKQHIESLYGVFIVGKKNL